MNIKQMSLEQKIGQMIIAGFPSNKYDEHIKEIIEENSIGNVILFSRNIGSKMQLAKLNENIQHNMIKHIGIPGFISIDQEGGMVSRTQEGVTFFPGNMAFGAADEADGTYKEGKMVGEELRALGINMNLAPVLDINNNPHNPVIGTRSYSDKAEKVIKYGIPYIKGLQQQGVIATAKHFPGHGNTCVDSHLDLPCIQSSIEELEKQELCPFREAVKANVEAIMSAHILFPSIEEEKLPATLSYKILTQLLRKKIGYNGLIITDCMEMKAIATYYGTEKAVVMAVKAGADLICISHTLDTQIKGIKAIKEAVKNREIPESYIDSVVERILKVKTKYNLFQNPYPDFERVQSKVGCKKHIEFSKSISQKSITLVKDKKDLIPINKKNIVSISTEPKILTGVDSKVKDKKLFCDAVKQRLGGQSFSVPLNPTKEIITNLVTHSEKADIIIIGTYNAHLNKGQVELINEIAKVNENIIVVSLRNPYDSMVLKNLSTYICTYEYTSSSIESVLNILTGNKKAVGKLPVNIDETFMEDNNEVCNRN